MTATINGWSVTDVVGIVACMIAMLAAVLLRRPLAMALVPAMNPRRRESPAETADRREARKQRAAMARVSIVAAAVLVWVFGILALIDGREGPILDALL